MNEKVKFVKPLCQVLILYEESNHKMHKILFYAQCCYMKIKNGQKLFSEDVIAYQDGPVVKSILIEHRPNIDEFLGSEEIYCDHDDEQFLIIVQGLLKNYSSDKLIELTHENKEWKECAENGITQSQIMTCNAFPSNLFEETLLENVEKLYSQEQLLKKHTTNIANIFQNSEMKVEIWK